MGICFSFCCMVWKYITTVFDKRSLHSPVEGCDVGTGAYAGQCCCLLRSAVLGLSQGRCLESTLIIFWVDMWELAMRWKLKWQPDEGIWVYLFHLYIIYHLTQEFLGCINTTQDCSSGQRKWIVFYFNERSRLLVTSLWRPLSDLTFLRLNTSYGGR